MERQADVVAARPRNKRRHRAGAKLCSYLARAVCGAVTADHARLFTKHDRCSSATLEGKGLLLSLLTLMLYILHLVQKPFGPRNSSGVETYLPAPTTILESRMSRLPLHNKEQTMVSAPPSRRSMLVYLALLAGLSWAAFAFYTGMITLPIKAVADEKILGADTGVEGYGLNAQPEFTNMIKLMDLPADYLPQTGSHRQAGRLVVVGDVHGMKHSLVHLLNKIKFDKKHDHLILAGDMISKGPDSAGVVDLAMELGATGVRGNHEDRILLVHNTMVAEHTDVGAPGPDEDSMKVQDLLEEESFSHGDYKDRKLAKALGKRRIEWLKKCPVILRVGTLGAMGEVVVVHAGLAPGVELEKQDPNLVMNMRTIGKEGIPSDSRSGTVWIKEKEYSIGIDTGCLKGGKLTAVVIEGGDSDHTRKIVHVNCPDGR